ncbi:hypothetical protein [Mycobacterium sp. DL592]|uniref:hypothetical protein n=1 Tax=Mycobacterium sp. DL592 TaxID=2675524 RepID=UPI001FB8A449|nr:hypothetical protein [Mycobacterium sp. DL592]
MNARTAVVATALVALVTPQWFSPATAWADGLVTYEVVSDDVDVANIEFQNAGGRVVVEGAVLPWRTVALVRVVRGAPPEGSQVRADWRPSSAPGRWVSVRIIVDGNVICQNTLDVGNAACYGITPRIT